MDDIELSHNEVMEEKHTVRLIKKSSINLPKICHLNTKIMNIQRFEFLNDSTCCPSLLGCRLVATT